MTTASTNQASISRIRIRKLTYSALFLALCLVLPFLTGQIPNIGSMLSPMHIPVLLCGMVCGWPWGLLVGFIAPIMRSLLFGMPPMFPTAISMAFELAAYGAISGILYKVLPKKPAYTYVSLIVAMIGGRVVWGLARYIIAGLQSTTFTFEAFVAGAITGGIPGIILHIVIIPPLVMLLKRAHLTLNEQ